MTRAVNTTDETHRIVTDSFSNLSQSVTGQMPRIASMMRTTCNIKKMNDCEPACKNQKSSWRRSMSSGKQLQRRLKEI